MITVGVAVNYYWKPSFPPSCQSAAALALRMLRENSQVGTVLLVDGSPSPDRRMEEICRECDCRYLHTGRELTFAQGYNVGWRTLPEPHVGLMASDIFAPKGTVQTLAAVLENPEVGSVFPYLSYGDYPAQVALRVRQAVTCEPSAMTLNLNLFKREVLERVGGVDEQYTGGYNDVILLMKIRRLGFRVVQVGQTYVNHLGSMTVSQGTTYKREADRVRFREQYAEFVAEHGKWHLAHWKRPLATSPKAARWWWVSQHCPVEAVRRRLLRFTMAREPELCRYPAPWGRG